MKRQSLLVVLLLAAGTLSVSAATPSQTTSPAPGALSAAAAGEATEWSAQRRRHVRRVAPVRRARGVAIGGIACTQFGCHPVPPGCTPVTGYDRYGYARGNDAVVCGYR